MQIFNGKKYEREIINYDIIKLLTLTSQCREFHKFFFAQLQLYNYNFTTSTPMVFADFLRNYSSHFFSQFIFAKKCKISWKSLRTKIQVFFGENLCSLETLFNTHTNDLRKLKNRPFLSLMILSFCKSVITEWVWIFRFFSFINVASNLTLLYHFLEFWHFLSNSLRLKLGSNYL